MRWGVRKTNREKTPEIFKKKLQASIPEVSEEEKAYLKEELKNAKEAKEGISLIKKYENLAKIINIVGKQGELFKRFKEEDEFFDCVDLSRSKVYFKIRLFKFLCKFRMLKNSTLTPSYLKSKLKQIKKVCKANPDIIGNKRNICSIIFYSFYPCFG